MTVSRSEQLADASVNRVLNVLVRVFPPINAVLTISKFCHFVLFQKPSFRLMQVYIKFNTSYDPPTPCPPQQNSSHYITFFCQKRISCSPVFFFNLDNLILIHPYINPNEPVCDLTTATPVHPSPMRNKAYQRLPKR